MGLFSETGKLLKRDHCEVNQTMGVSRLSRNSRTIYFTIIKVVLEKSIDSRKFSLIIVNKNNLAAKS